MTFLLSRLVGDLAATRPDAPAVTMDGDTLTFAELDRRSDRLAQALAGLGVAPGDRVAVLSRNTPRFWELVFGTSKAGAVLVALNWRLSARELGAVVSDADPVLVLVQDDLASLVPDGIRTIDLGAPYDGLLDSVAPGTEVPAVEADAETVVLQLYSSGTTGRPKGVLITNGNLAVSPRSAEELYGMGPDSVNLVVSPLFHIGGLGYGLTALSLGAHTVLVSHTDGPSLLETIERWHVSHSFMVPALIQVLLEAPTLATTDLSSLCYVAYGGAPMSPGLLRQAIAGLACGFIGVYGMTETSGTVVALPAVDHDADGERSHLLASCGRPLPWAGEVTVVSTATGRPAAPGEVGEIWVRSSMNTPGYWRQPDATREALRDDGWLRTGDAAYADAEGYVYIHDRMKDMIISGGENIFPAEVEAVLFDLPGVREVAVIGVPSHRWGETVKAVVVTTEGSRLDEAGVIAFARDNLAHYKCPTSVAFVDALPRNATGKLQKAELRRHHAGTEVVG